MKSSEQRCNITKNRKYQGDKTYKEIKSFISETLSYNIIFTFLIQDFKKP